MRAHLFVSLWLSACAAEDVVIASLPSLDAGDDAGADSGVDAGPFAGCKGQWDCAPGEYCEKSACGDERGTCSARPLECASGLSPVCGCDGLTYFHDCLRKQSGVSASHAGACEGDAVRCGGRMDARCPRATSCAKLLRDRAACQADLVGTCWVLPECDGSREDGERFAPCAGDRVEECVDTCAAIHSNKPHFRALRCER